MGTECSGHGPGTDPVKDMYTRCKKIEVSTNNLFENESGRRAADYYIKKKVNPDWGTGQYNRIQQSNTTPTTKTTKS